MFVEVPIADKYTVRQNSEVSHLWHEKDKISNIIELPLGKWKILALSTDLTEEQMKEICDFSEMAAEGIDDHEGGYLCYVRGYWHHKTVQESYSSMKEANNIDDTKTRFLVLVSQE